jgi:hypothetical protein
VTGEFKTDAEIAAEKVAKGTGTTGASLDTSQMPPGYTIATGAQGNDINVLGPGGNLVGVGQYKNDARQLNIAWDDYFKNHPELKDPRKSGVTDSKLITNRSVVSTINAVKSAIETPGDWAATKWQEQHPGQEMTADDIQGVLGSAGGGEFETEGWAYGHPDEPIIKADVAHSSKLQDILETLISSPNAVLPSGGSSPPVVFSPTINVPLTINGDANKTDLVDLVRMVKEAVADGLNSFDIERRIIEVIERDHRHFNA